MADDDKKTEEKKGYKYKQHESTNNKNTTVKNYEQQNKQINELDKRPVYTPLVTTYNRTKTANGFTESSALLKRYYSMIDAEIYFNNHYVEDVRSIDWSISQQTQPLFGYNSYRYDEVAQGNRIVQGQFVINFSSPGYLNDILEAAAADNEKIEIMKSYVIPAHKRVTVGTVGERKNYEAGKNIFNPPEHYNIWPETFDIDAIFGQKTKASNAVHIILQGVKITSSAIGMSADGAGNPCILETYGFLARDIKKIS